MRSYGRCAGAAHSACLDQSGAVLAWRSADPGLHVQEVGGALDGKRVVHISAGVPSWIHPSAAHACVYSVVKEYRAGRTMLNVLLKSGLPLGVMLSLFQASVCDLLKGFTHCAAGKYRTAAVTEEGDVYMWEGWSKPAELSSGGRGATGERVAQAMGRPEQQGTPSGGSAGGKRPPRPPSSAGGEDAIQDAAAARRGRKSERARALVHQRILPARCYLLGCSDVRAADLNASNLVGFTCSCLTNPVNSD